MAAARAGRRGAVRGLTVLVATLLAFACLVWSSPAAMADSAKTFRHGAAVGISGASDGSTAQSRSAIEVSGLSGAVAEVSVRLRGLTHPRLDRVALMLVAPSGENLVLLSRTDAPTEAAGAAIEFADSADASVPSGDVPSGSFRPTSTGSPEGFTEPAPEPSTETTFAGAFGGIDPNGVWQLFVVDGSTVGGELARGWTLTIGTAVAVQATSVSLEPSDAGSAGEPAIFVATVQAGDAPVTRGSVQLSVDGELVGDPVRLGESGTAKLAVSELAEGTYEVAATYSGAKGYQAGEAVIRHRVTKPTVVEGRSFCNPGPVTLPGAAGSRHPSVVDVSGLKGVVSKVTVTLRGLSQSAPDELSLMLAAPRSEGNPDVAGGVVLLGGAGGDVGVNGLTVTFDDDAAAGVSSAIRSGTFRPTDRGAASFPKAAPSPSRAPGLSAFDGLGPNGSWNLWVVDASTGRGSLSDGWCITVESKVSTTTTLTSKSEPVAGEPMTFTAVVTAEDGPVTDGSVRLRDADGALLGGPAEVGADGSATIVVDSLTAGVHAITASYSGSAEHAASSGDVSPTVRPVANAGGPYRIAVGDSLVLDGSRCSPGGTYDWDVNGDGIFDDATGSAPTLDWADLRALGVRNRGGRYQITVRVAAGPGALEYARARLEVSPAASPAPSMAPTLSASKDNSASVGAPVTVKLRPTNLESSTGTKFTYTIDWGDGTPTQTVNGPADTIVTHAFTKPGKARVRYTVTEQRTGRSVQAAALTVHVSDDGGESSSSAEPTTQPAQGSDAASPAADDEGAEPASSGSRMLVSWLLVGGVLVAAAVAVLFELRRDRFRWLRRRLLR